MSDLDQDEDLDFEDRDECDTVYCDDCGGVFLVIDIHFVMSPGACVALCEECRLERESKPNA